MIIIESQYFAPVAVFKTLIQRKDVDIDGFENFQKASFRNRCLIFGGNGLVPLTIPVKGGRIQKVQMKDVQIDYSESWQRSHKRSLLSSYSKAPFYDYYKDGIEELISSNEKFLFDLNFKILLFLVKALGVEANIGFTSEYISDIAPEKDYRNKVLPKNFQENMQSFTPKYPQVFEDRFGFQPNLSILDLLFCEGPNAANLLNVP